MNVKISYASCIGTRPENQDQFLVPGRKRMRPLPEFVAGQTEAAVRPGKPLTLAVIDGMGGESNGAEAAQTVGRALQKHRFDDAEQRAYRINEAVLRLQQKRGAAAGATLTSVDLSTDGRSIIAYVSAAGDSPCYLIKQNDETRTAAKITRDENLYAKLLEQGNAPTEPDEIARAKAGLLNYFGRQGAVPLQQYRLLIDPGDVLVLCSDGVQLNEDDHLYFLEDGIENPAEELVQNSVNLNCIKNKNSDNTTAIVVEF